MDLSTLSKIGLEMAHFTRRSIAQVFGVLDTAQYEHRGSALFCMLNGRQAVITAAHVLDETAEEGRFVSLGLSRGDESRPGVVPGRIRYKRESDLAFYEPDWNFALGEDKSYWAEAKVDRFQGLPVNDYMIIHGYPERFSRFTNLGGPIHFADSYAHLSMKRLTRGELSNQELRTLLRQTPDYPFLPEGFLKPYQFALNYGAGTGPFMTPEGEELTSPGQWEDWNALYESGVSLPGQKTFGAHGLSDSPVWRLGLNDGPIEDWSLDRVQLVGIITHWNEARHALIGTLAREFPVSTEG
jgi:hypothetical protein